MLDNNQEQLPAKPDGLFTLDEALNLNREQVKDLHKKYLNSALVNLLGLINFDRQFVKARGLSVWDSEGREYLDFLGAFGALNLGHNHPKILAALEKVKELPNLLQSSLGILAGALASNLAKITPGNLTRSFFCNSGAEAVEFLGSMVSGELLNKHGYHHCLHFKQSKRNPPGTTSCRNLQSA